jgi:hypothetical protein
MMIKKDINTKNIFLCSFGTDDLEIDKNRFLNQALKFNIFKDIYIYNFSDLDEKTKKFIRVTSTDKQKTKGYNHGYFVWKPHIIKKTLDKIPEDSILLYADLGCILNTKGLETLYAYVNYCQKYSCVGFQYRSPSKLLLKKLNYKTQKYYEYNYTKMEVFNHFDISKNHEIYNSEQIWAGAFLLKKNKITKNFVDEWIKASTIQLLKTEYKSKKNPKLIQSSHDQSIFSILFKKYKFKSLCANIESEWVLIYDEDNNPKKYWDHLSYKPIQARRKLTMKLNFLTKIKNYFLSKLNKF